MPATKQCRPYKHPLSAEVKKTPQYHRSKGREITWSSPCLKGGSGIPTSHLANVECCLL